MQPLFVPHRFLGCNHFSRAANSQSCSPSMRARALGPVGPVPISDGAAIKYRIRLGILASWKKEKQWATKIMNIGSKHLATNPYEIITYQASPDPERTLPNRILCLSTSCIPTANVASTRTMVMAKLLQMALPLWFVVSWAKLESCGSSKAVRKELVQSSVGTLWIQLCFQQHFCE